MTIARDIAKSIGSSVRSGKIASDGDITGDFNATIYDSTVNLPTTGVLAGAQAYVSSNQRLYIRGTGGWYNIATINNTPTINSVQTAGGDSSPFTLATDGLTTTVITINATDSEGFPITFSAVTDVGFDSIATVSSDSSVFTITPFSEDSAGTATSGTITFKASDGVNIASEVATFTILFRVQGSAHTVLLVKGSGNNKTNDAAPTDAKGNTVTRSGTYNTAKSPYSKRAIIFQNDAADTNYIRADAALDSLTSTTPDCTFEGWYYLNSASNTTFEALFGCNAANDGDNILIVSYRASKLECIYNKQTTQASTLDIPVGEWFYLAVTLDSSDGLRIYVNGELYISDTVETLHAALSACDFLIGAEFDSSESAGNYLNGYVSDFRISNTVRYSGEHAVPINYLSSDSNTIFHVLGSSSTALVIDQSSNALDINDGSSSAIVKGGYNRHLTQSAVVLPPHADHAGHSFDTGSIFFDGSNDYLRCDAALDSFTSTSDPWTIEAWVWNRDNDDNTYWLGINTASAGTNVILWRSGGRLEVDSTNYSPSTDEETGGMWSHRLATFDGTNVYLYINGKQIASGANAPNTALASCVLLLGAEADAANGGSLGNYWEGYISDFRIRSSYTSSVTVPTSPLSTTGDTVFHLKGNDAGVYDAAAGRALTLNGDAKSSTAQKKYAASSIVFDGTGDYVETATNIAYTYGTGDFTIEAWVYITANPSNYAYILGQGAVVASNASFGLYIQSGVFKVYNNAVVITGTTSYSLNTWHHVVLTRGNGVLSLFLDGSLEGSATNTNNITTGTAQGPSIGRWAEVGDGGYFAGYVEDLRIAKGLSRYPYIPAKETLTSDTNTSLLIGHASSFTDGSSNSHTVTSNGNAAISNRGPHPTMKSIYLNGGSGDHVQIANSTDFQLSNTTSSWQMEYYVYSLSASGIDTHAACWDQNASADDWLLANNDGAIVFYIASHSDSNALLTSASIFEARKWYHIAIVNDTTNITMFVDGTKVTSAATPSTTTTSGSVFRLGRYGNENSDGPFNGYISNFRLKKGGYDYTNSFTPPTAELTT